MMHGRKNIKLLLLRLMQQSENFCRGLFLRYAMKKPQMKF